MAFWGTFAKVALKALPYLGSAASGFGLSQLLNNNSSEKVDSTSGSEADIRTYLEGLLASQGQENDLNREYNSAEAALNRQFQHDEAELQRQWYTEMSNSAYQRSVADMQKAGINPILAYQQGGAASAVSGVPAGSSASYNVGGGDTLSSLLSSVADLVAAINGSSKKVSTRAIGFRN